MFLAIYVLYAGLTLIALLGMLIAFHKRSDTSMGISIWCNLLAMLILYQLAGGEILGIFFGYTNALLYTINLLLMVIAISYILLNAKVIKRNKITTYGSWGLAVLIIFAGLLLLSNVWINARFIENRKLDKPVLQVATLGQNPHCRYRYVFYKIRPDGKAEFLCPNHYGLIPVIGTLETTPDFLRHQFQQG